MKFVKPRWSSTSIAVAAAIGATACSDQNTEAVHRTQEPIIDNEAKDDSTVNRSENVADAQVFYVKEEKVDEKKELVEKLYGCGATVTENHYTKDKKNDMFILTAGHCFGKKLEALVWATKADGKSASPIFLPVKTENTRVQFEKAEGSDWGLYRICLTDDDVQAAIKKRAPGLGYKDDKDGVAKLTDALRALQKDKARSVLDEKKVAAVDVTYRVYGPRRVRSSGHAEVMVGKEKVDINSLNWVKPRKGDATAFLWMMDSKVTRESGFMASTSITCGSKGDQALMIESDDPDFDAKKIDAVKGCGVRRVIDKDKKLYKNYTLTKADGWDTISGDSGSPVVKKTLSDGREVQVAVVSQGSYFAKATVPKELAKKEGYTRLHSSGYSRFTKDLLVKLWNKKHADITAVAPTESEGVVIAPSFELPPHEYTALPPPPPPPPPLDENVDQGTAGAGVSSSGTGPSSSSIASSGTGGAAASSGTGAEGGAGAGVGGAGASGSSIASSGTGGAAASSGTGAEGGAGTGVGGAGASGGFGGDGGFGGEGGGTGGDGGGCQDCCSFENTELPPPPSCLYDYECTSGLVCDQGECGPPQCVDDAQCPIHESCSGGLCLVVAPTSCAEDADCQTGTTCLEGECVDGGSPPVE